MSYGRIIGVVAVAVVGAAFGLGCGSDGEAASEATKTEFTKEAEAVCKERKKEWDTEVEAFTRKSEAEDQAKGQTSPKKVQERSEAFFSASIIPLLEEEMAALEDLDVPEADEAKVERMLQSRSSGIEKLKDEGTKALLGEPFKEFEKKAKAYGLNCPPLL